MADETQNAPVAGATTENATQQKVYIYYYSDPDGATKNERCHMIKSDFPFDKPLPYHIHDVAPDENMVDPVWNQQLNGGLGDWQENSGKAQSQILAQVQEKLGQIDTKSKELDAKAQELDTKAQQLDKTEKSLQEQQQAGTAQSLALTKSIKALSDNQADQNKLLASMQQLILKIASGQTATTTPSVSKEPTQPTAAPQGITAAQPANN